MNSRRSLLKPWDYGVKKLSIKDSKLQRMIWFYQMKRFFEELDLDEGDPANLNRTWREKNLTFVMLLGSIESDMLESIFHSKSKEFLKCQDTNAVFTAVYEFISKK